MKIKRDVNSIDSIVEGRLDNLRDEVDLIRTKIFIVENAIKLFKAGEITEEEIELITAFDVRFRTQTSYERVRQIQNLFDAN